MRNLKFISLIVLSIGLYACEADDTDKLDEQNDSNIPTECNYSTFSGSTNCGDGFVAVSDNYCCPTNYPFWAQGTENCYTSCMAAENAGAIQVIKGNNGSGSGGDGNGGNTGCDWTRAINLCTVSATVGERCGSPTSYEMYVTNNSNIRIKTYMCIQKIDGTYIPYGDVNGIQPGETKYLGYVCEGNGQYILFAEYWDIFIANGNCGYGGCQ